MYCTNCGRELPDGTRFCNFCGVEQTDLTKGRDSDPVSDCHFTPNITPPSQEPRRKKHTLLKLVGLIGAAAVCAVTAFFVTFNLLDFLGEKGPNNQLEEAAVSISSTAEAPLETSKAQTAENPLETSKTPKAKTPSETAKARKQPSMSAEEEKDILSSYLAAMLIPSYGITNLAEHHFYYWDGVDFDLSDCTGLVCASIDDFDKDDSLEMIVITSSEDSLNPEKTSGQPYGRLNFDVHYFELKDGAPTEKQTVEHIIGLDSCMYGNLYAAGYDINGCYYFCFGCQSQAPEGDGSLQKIYIYEADKNGLTFKTGFSYTSEFDEKLEELTESGDTVILCSSDMGDNGHVSETGKEDNGHISETGKEDNGHISETGNRKFDSMEEAMNYMDDCLAQYGAAPYWTLNLSASNPSLKKTKGLLGALLVEGYSTEYSTEYQFYIWDNSNIRSTIRQVNQQRHEAASVSPLTINDKHINDQIEEDGKTWCTINLTYPQFSTKNRAHRIEPINRFFADRAQTFSSNMRESVDETLPDMKQYDISAYAAESDYSIGLNNGHVISITFDTYEYMGGAHGYAYLTFENFDVITGQRLSLTDMGQDPDTLMEFIWDRIIQMAEENGSAQNMFEGYQDTIRDFNYDSAWLLDEDGICFIFNAYDLASYADGRFTYTIPYSDLDPYLNSYAKTLLER